jgi:hypothetical protein
VLTAFADGPRRYSDLAEMHIDEIHSARTAYDHARRT